MFQTYPALYQDAQGTEHTIIENDGKQLRMVVRGVEFVGTDFDALEPTLDSADPRMVSFTLAGGSLCACHIECVLPLPVIVGLEPITGKLQVHLELGHPRPGPQGGIDRETLHLCLSFGDVTLWSKGASGYFEDELLDIQQALPEGTYLQACITCAFSDYLPAGHGLFGSLACFRDNKAAYRQVTGKRGLFAIWNTMTEFVQETYLCPE
ncbi:MAG TPA: DUF6304 family protein, partial [Ktedonobacterales bacterium]|nr:DUF6304 family protein [Ktedonobacterales bacterium]